MGCGASHVPEKKQPAEAKGQVTRTNKQPKRWLRLTYRSELRPNTPIEDIIKRANIKNDRLDIAGALWYNKENNTIRQILEGEREAVRELYSVISKDPRHFNIVTEIEEYPLRRAYKKWGGMAFSDNPTFQNKDKNIEEDLCKLSMTYNVETKNLKAYLDNALDDEDHIEIGRVIYCRQETGEVLERVEGDRASVEFLLKSMKHDNWVQNIRESTFDPIAKREFHVFSTKDICRFASADDSIKRIRFELENCKFQASMYNGFDMTTGAIQAVVMFREKTSTKDVCDSVIRDDFSLLRLEEACLSSIRATPQVNSAERAEAKNTTESIKVLEAKLPGITLDYALMNPPLGFMVRKNKLLDSEENAKKYADMPKAVLIPTSNLELRKLCEGKLCSLVSVNDTNVAFRGSKFISQVLRKATEKYPVKLKLNLRDDPSLA